MTTLTASQKGQLSLSDQLSSKVKEVAVFKDLNSASLISLDNSVTMTVKSFLTNMSVMS